MESLFAKPEFFDVFGLMAFIFITSFAFYMLYTKKMPSKWLAIVLLIIGILGLIIDGAIVFINYLK